MEKSLKSFAKAIGENKNIRRGYGSDPIRALQDFGLDAISLDELTSDEAMQTLFHLPGMSSMDAMSAYAKILEFFAEGGRQS